MEGILISQLPRDIIHHILSFLHTKEAAKISIFCKAWHSAWLTCPTLNFGESYVLAAKNSGEKFFEFFGNTFKRYREQNLGIVQLSLALTINDSYLALLVDECVRIAVQNGVKKLEIDFHVRHGLFTLCPKIFEAKALRELRIYCPDVKFRKENISDKVKFIHLQKLHLLDINIDDDMLEDIIMSSPLIEDLNICFCRGLKRIKVTKLYNLKKLEIWAWGNQFVEIDAPNLQYLYCRGDEGFLDLCASEKLKYLHLVGTLPSATDFNNFMQKFPQVEDLGLFNIPHVERINISSHSLKHIIADGSKAVKIDAPNLASLTLFFDFGFFLDLPLELVSTSSRIELHVYLEGIERMDTDEFYKMKELLTKLVQYSKKISLCLNFSPGCIFDNIRIIQIPSCPSIDQVEDIDLYFGSFTESTTNLLDALLLTFHPKVITMEWEAEPPRFLYDYLNLMIEERRRRGCPLSTRRDETKSWLKDLKEVRFEMYDQTAKKLQPTNRKNMLEAILDCKNVCFRLEWIKLRSLLWFLRHS